MSHNDPDPFARFGITHLSPSSLRVYREDPAAWCVRYLLKVKGEFGPKSWRGKAVEAGMDKILWGHPYEDAVRAMQLQWDNECMGLVSEEAGAEYAVLEDYLKQAIEAFKGYSVPLMRQRAISWTVPGLSVPIIGYVDWMWHSLEGQKGVDLKTTKVMPPHSRARPEHVEQVSLYAHVTGAPFSLIYVTPKKRLICPVTADEVTESLIRLRRGALAIQSMLRHCDTPAEALRMFSPDIASWNWDVPMIEAALEIYEGGEP